MLAPICLFTYNRPQETYRTIEALKYNYLASASELYIFSDGPKKEAAKTKVDEVRTYLRSVSGFKKVEVFESPNNKGLANSIIDGVTRIIAKHGKVIVLEDDLITSPNFLDFMNQALDFYQNEAKVQSINGYSLLLKNTKSNIYFHTRPFPWGWATWNNRWSQCIFDKAEIKTIIDKDKSILDTFKKVCGNDISRMLMGSLNNKNDSWYVRWTFDHFRKETYSVFPSESFVQNIGHNDDGTHCKGINTYKSVPINHNDRLFLFTNTTSPTKKDRRDFLRYFTLRHKLITRIKLSATKSGRKNLIIEIKSKLGVT